MLIEPIDVGEESVLPVWVARLRAARTWPLRSRPAEGPVPFSSSFVLMPMAMHTAVARNAATAYLFRCGFSHI